MQEINSYLSIFVHVKGFVNVTERYHYTLVNFSGEKKVFFHTLYALMKSKMFCKLIKSKI